MRITIAAVKNYNAYFSFGLSIFETNHAHMKNSGPINTVVINRKKYILIFFSLLLGYLLLFTVLTVWLNQFSILAVGMAVMFFALLFFEKRIRKPFCKNAEVQFFEDYFSVIISDINCGETEYTDINKYNEIDSFITSSGRGDMYSLNLYFRDGSIVKYTFCNNKYGSKSYNGQGVYLPKSRVLNRDISLIFFQCAQDFNAAHPDKAITIHPTYFATSESHVVVIIVSVFIAIAIGMVSYSKPAALPVCLIPVFFFYGIVISSKSSYKSDMKNLSRA